MRARRVLMVFALVVWSLTPVRGSASDVASVDTTDGLCDPGSVSQFSDVEAGDYGAEYILCMRALGLSVGTGDGSYGAELELSRAQMASFLVRLWSDLLEERCPGGVDIPFVDIAGNTHEDSIGCLYGLEVTKGTTAVTYGPGQKLRASQISLFLMRLYEAGGNSCGGADDALERAVECLTVMNITPSVTEAGSSGFVTRDQMAVYVIGLWHNMAGQGLPPDPPEKPSTHGATTTETATLARRPGQDGDDDDDDDPDDDSTTRSSSTTIATDNDGTDSDGYDTPETDNTATSTVTTSSTATTQGSSTTIATDNDGTDSDGYDTPTTPVSGSDDSDSD